MSTPTITTHPGRQDALAVARQMIRDSESTAARNPHGHSTRLLRTFDACLHSDPDGLLVARTLVALSDLLDEVEARYGCTLSPDGIRDALRGPTRARPGSDGLAPPEPAPTDSPRDRHLTPNDLAIYFGLPLSTIYGWRSKGVGPRGFRVGKFIRYRLSDVEAWEQEQIDKEAQQ